MKRERRQPTRREWAQITSSRPVVRRYPRPDSARLENLPDGASVQMWDASKGKPRDLTEAERKQCPV